MLLATKILEPAWREMMGQWALPHGSAGAGVVLACTLAGTGHAGTGA
jgi:hypothetical protein